MSNEFFNPDYELLDLDNYESRSNYINTIRNEYIEVDDVLDSCKSLRFEEKEFLKEGLDFEVIHVKNIINTSLGKYITVFVPKEVKKVPKNHYCCDLNNYWIIWEKKDGSRYLKIHSDYIYYHTLIDRAFKDKSFCGLVNGYGHKFIKGYVVYRYLGYYAE